MSLRRPTRLLATFVLPGLLVTACSLLGGGSGNTEGQTGGIVTATPSEGTLVPPNAGPTETPTPTPTLHPTFPTPVLVESWIAEQEFEHGWGFSLQDRSEIWVAAFNNSRGGTWTIYEDAFAIEEQRTGQQLVITFDQAPPEGRVMPVRGFGWLWANNEEVREALGWAVWIELGQASTLRYDAGGLINADGQYVPRPGRFTLTNLGGDVFIFDEASATFTWVPAAQ